MLLFLLLVVIGVSDSTSSSSIYVIQLRAQHAMGQNGIIVCLAPIPTGFCTPTNVGVILLKITSSILILIIV